MRVAWIVLLAAAGSAQRPVDIPKLPELPKLPERATVTLAEQAAPPKQSPPDLTMGLKPTVPRRVAPLGDSVSTLANGMRVALRADRRAPWVTGALVIHTGTHSDPEGKAGVTETSVRALRAGDLDAKLAELGVQVSAEVAETASTLSFRCVSTRLDLALEALRTMAVAPVIEPEGVDAARAGIRSRVAGRYSNLEGATTFHLHQAVFGKSRPVPDYESVSNLGPEDVVAFHRRYVAPRNVAIVVAGDFDPAVLRPRLAALFGGWKGADAPAPANASAPAASLDKPVPRGVLLGEAAQSSSAGFAMGRQCPGAGDPSAAATMVLSELITAAIEKAAAANRSWALRAGAFWDPGLSGPGLLRVRGIVDLTYPVDAMIAILNAMTTLRKGGFSDAAVEEAKLRALGAWASRFATPLQRMVQSEVARRAGLVDDHAAVFHGALGSVTTSDVARAAQALLNPADFHLVLIGNSTLSSQPVSALREPVEKVALTIPAPKPLDVRTDPASIEQGKRWLSRMQQSLGGAEKLAAIKDFSISTSGTLAGGKTTVVDRFIAPLTFRQDQETPETPFSVFYNGAIGWVGKAGRISALSPGLLAQVRAEAFRLIPLLALSDRDPKRTVSHAGANIVVITSQHGSAVRLYLDEQTALPVRLFYQSMTQSGVPTNMEETWSEWKEIDGIKLPATVVIRQDGRKLGEMRMTEAKFNSGLKMDDLELKP